VDKDNKHLSIVEAKEISNGGYNDLTLQVLSNTSDDTNSYGGLRIRKALNVANSAIVYLNANYGDITGVRNITASGSYSATYNNVEKAKLYSN